MYSEGTLDYLAFISTVQTLLIAALLVVIIFPNAGLKVKSILSYIWEHRKELSKRIAAWSIVIALAGFLIWCFWSVLSGIFNWVDTRPFVVERFGSAWGFLGAVIIGIVLLYIWAWLVERLKRFKIRLEEGGHLKVSKKIAILYISVMFLVVGYIVFGFLMAILERISKKGFLNIPIACFLSILVSVVLPLLMRKKGHKK
jgi:MFS family permease